MASGDAGKCDTVPPGARDRLAHRHRGRLVGESAARVDQAGAAFFAHQPGLRLTVRPPFAQMLGVERYARHAVTREPFGFGGNERSGRRRRHRRRCAGIFERPNAEPGQFIDR
ncbi:hypothetical protein D3C83_19550 [compost metagenome]